MNAHNTFAPRLNLGALGLALVATLATMGSLQQLASTEGSVSNSTQTAQADAAAQPAVQQVVVVGKRASHA